MESPQDYGSLNLDVEDTDELSKPLTSKSRANNLEEIETKSTYSFISPSLNSFKSAPPRVPLFRLEQVKEDIWREMWDVQIWKPVEDAFNQLVQREEKALNRKEYEEKNRIVLSRKYAPFTNFLRGKGKWSTTPGICDKFLTHTLLYMCSLIGLEKSRLQYKLKDSEFDLTQFEEEYKETINRLTELAFSYTQVLQFVRQHYKPNSEKLFFETLYRFVTKLVLIKFSDNQKLLPILETEVMRLFRTKHFTLSPDEKRDIERFISAQDLFKLKRVFNSTSLPSRHDESSKKPSKRHVHSAAKARSPLVNSVFPTFNKFSYATKGILDRGFGDLRLSIPPDALLERVDKKKSEKDEKETEEAH